MTLPTYADLVPTAIAWAADRGLLHPDGTANQATPEAQRRKTLEELGEASLELRKLTKTRVLIADYRVERMESLRARTFSKTPSIDVAAVLPRRKHRLALELGDILVTLVLQSALQGSSWDECLARAHEAHFPTTWQFVDIHASGLTTAIAHYSRRTPAYIGAIARCIEDVARIELAMTGPECLALALEKISGRTGAIVDGVFVKA